MKLTHYLVIPCDLHSEKVYISVLSNFLFIGIPSTSKVICSFTRALLVTLVRHFLLFVCLFEGQIIDKTRIVTVQTMVNLKSVSSHRAANYSSISYIIANFTSPVDYSKKST